MSEITPDDQARLLQLARDALQAEVRGEPAPPAEADREILRQQRGCFVTLTNAGRLRGCIGNFAPREPLAVMVPEMARSAAHDPRFVADPVTPAELEAIRVEVSILSPLEKTARPEKLEVGRHGIYIVAGGRSGCFLPEVATDQGWTAEEFLSYCCSHKAGLSADAWRMADCEVFLFTSAKFSEPAGS